MSLSLWIEKKSYEVGSASFLKSFFSTIFVRLENNDWGKLFPIIMNEFYIGELNYQKCDKAIEEIMKIREMFKNFSPDQIVWDFEDLKAKPPWGDEISNSITSLSNYFCTSDGKDLFDVLLSAFREARRKKRKVIIQ
jgi:2,3-bisphosphoglycerate-dependent phosphoglycerate mutase